MHAYIQAHNTNARAYIPTYTQVKTSICESSVVSNLLTALEDCRLVGLIPLLSSLFLDARIDKFWLKRNGDDPNACMSVSGSGETCSVWLAHGGLRDCYDVGRDLDTITCAVSALRCVCVCVCVFRCIVCVLWLFENVCVFMCVYSLCIVYVYGCCVCVSLCERMYVCIYMCVYVYLVCVLYVCMVVICVYHCVYVCM